MKGKAILVSIEPPQQQENTQIYLTSQNIVHKLNGSDGSVLWQVQLHGSKKPYSARHLYLAKVNDLVYAEETGNRTIVAVRGSDGRPMWRWHCSSRRTSTRHDNTYIFRIYTDDNRMYIHSLTEKRNKGALTALDLSTGEVVWVQKWTNGNYPFRWVKAVHGTLFTGETTMQGKRRLCAFDGATGRERWRFEEEGASLPPDTGTAADLPPCVVDGIVYDNGNPLYALDAHTGEKLWERRTFSQHCDFSQLFVHNGVVYADTGDGYAGDFPPEFYYVFAFEAKTGKLLWQSGPGYILGKAVWDEDGAILMGGEAEPGESKLGLTLQAREAESGKLRWQVSVGKGGTFHSISSLINAVVDPSFFPIYIAEKKVYLLKKAQPSLQVFNVHSGQYLTEYPLSLPTSEGILESWLRHQKLYVTTWKRERRSDGPWNYALYAVHLGSGTTEWKFEIGPQEREYPHNWIVLPD